MFNGLVGKNGEYGGDTDAIIGAQRRSVGCQPFTIDDGLNGVLEEIEHLRATETLY